MIIKELPKDLFPVSKDYALVHCISADFKLGAGIARKFDELFNARQKLFNVFPGSWIPRWDKTQERFRGGSIILFSDYTFFNLVTKRNYWDKPTLTTIENALIWMKKQCENHYITKLVMPKIGCGMDRQNWSDVKSIIERVFADMDIEIVVCNL